VSHRVGIVKRFCETIGPLGAVMCAVLCLGLPIVSGILGVAGLNFLRDDRFLIPFEILCCVAFLWALERGGQVHGRRIVVWLASVAAGTLLGSMFLTGIHSEAAVLFACIVLIVATILNQVFLKRCSCTPHHPNGSRTHS
jgi:MerC mercury resistance protein